MTYDVAIVGAGVVGGLIARELSRYDIKVALLEKFNDVKEGDIYEAFVIEEYRD